MDKGGSGGVWKTTASADVRSQEGEESRVRWLAESRTAGVLTDDPTQNTKQKAGRRNDAADRRPGTNCD